MDFPPQAIEELKALYQKHRNLTLSDQEALAIATKLYNLFSAIYKPIPKTLLAKQRHQFPQFSQLIDKLLSDA